MASPASAPGPNCRPPDMPRHRRRAAPSLSTPCKPLTSEAAPSLSKRRRGVGRRRQGPAPSCRAVHCIASGYGFVPSESGYGFVHSESGYGFVPSESGYGFVHSESGYGYGARSYCIASCTASRCTRIASRRARAQLGLRMPGLGPAQLCTVIRACA